MNYKTIANVLGKLLIVTGSSLIFPIICSLYYGEDDLFSLVVSAAVTISAGYLLWRRFKHPDGILDSMEGQYLWDDGCPAVWQFSGGVHIDHHRVHHRGL
jgi:trk system potassium uptake protein TrkH